MVESLLFPSLIIREGVKETQLFRGKSRQNVQTTEKPLLKLFFCIVTPG